MIGKFFRTIDEKKRVTIPPKFKDKLGTVFYTTLNPDGAIELRSKKAFDHWKDALLSINSLSKDGRSFIRILLGNSAKVEIDNQGRILLPTHLIKKTCITKEVVFVGLGNKIELWSRENYEKFEKKFSSSDDLDLLTRKLHSEGIKI